MSNGSSDVDFKDIMMLHKDYTKEPNSFLVNDATLGKWMFVRKSKQSEKKKRKTKSKTKLKTKCNIAALSSGNIKLNLLLAKMFYKKKTC